MTDGGPAFPVIEVDEHRQPYHTNPGMSLRDYFASKAMQALIAGNTANPNAAKTILESSKKEGVSPEAYVSKMAYDIADAMLKER